MNGWKKFFVYSAGWKIGTNFLPMYIPPPPPLVLENGGGERAAPQANHLHLQIDESYTTEKISATQSAK